MSKSTTSLYPALAGFFAVAGFLLVLNMAITEPEVQKTKTSNSTNKATLTNNTNGLANEHTDTGSADDSTASWKTYTSKQYGLTFKYPSDWEVEEGALNSPYSVFAHPKTGPETPALRFWLDRAYDGLSTPSGTKTTTSNVTYAGRSAVLSQVITPANELLIAHIQFTTTPIGWGSDSTISINPTGEGSINIPLQIMGTLSIADPTADWKTYTDTKNGFSIKYPPTWTYATLEEMASTKVEFTKPGNDIIEPAVIIRPITIDQLKEELRSNLSTIGNNLTMTIGNTTANGFTYTGAIGADYDYYQLTKNGKSYFFFSKSNDSDWNRALSTFTFTQ